MNGASRPARPAALPNPLRTNELAASVIGLTSVRPGPLHRVGGGGLYKATLELQERKCGNGGDDMDRGSPLHGEEAGSRG